MTAPGSRDLRIDFLRGAAIFAMVVDHVGGDRSWLYALTGGDQFYVSAAECFVFLAGVVCGLVYGPRAARGGGSAAVKLLKRAGALYLWTMALTLTAPFVASALRLGWDDPLRRYSPGEFVARVLTLHLTYHLTDVLLLYVLLFGVAGTVIVWMVDGHTRAVLITSWSVWALWQTSNDYPVPWDIRAMNVFQFAAWQALFVTGIAIGIHRDALGGWLSPRMQRLCLAAAGLALAGTIVAYHLRGVTHTFGPNGATHLLSKADLGIGRLVVFAILSLFAIGLVTVGWRWLNAALGWLLLPLGQNSLAAYILHVGVVIAVTKMGAIAFGQTNPSAAQNSLLEMTGVLMVWGLVLGLVKARELRTLPGGYGRRHLPRILAVRVKPV